MGWEKRQRGGRYYTRSRKAGGRVVREYIGRGSLAMWAAQLDEAARDRRQREQTARRKEREQLEVVERDLRRYCALVSDALREHLVAAGFHQHKRGEWRRKRMAKTAKTAKTATGDTGETRETRDAREEARLDEQLRQAHGGDLKAANALVAMLKKAHGENWGARFPSPAVSVRERLLATVLGKDFLEREIWARQAEELQRELEGPAPTPLERVLCERVATCWLDMQLTDLVSARVHGRDTLTRAVSDYWQSRQDRAQRRYLDAALALARMRKLLAPMIAQLNIAQAGAQQLNLSMPDAVAKPATPSQAR